VAKSGLSCTFAAILSEIGGTLAQVSAQQVEALGEAMAQAGAVFTTGEGRSGLVGRCFAMRLMHLGLKAHVVGEAMAPAVRASDLLVAISGSGETAVTCLLASQAKKQGARVAALTAAADSPLAATADVVILVPAPTKEQAAAASIQHGGSLFEQSALILLDAIALQLQRRLHQTDEQMRARHANLE
jgi:6-phospho-3-hexuloisomerase